MQLAKDSGAFRAMEVARRYELSTLIDSLFFHLAGQAQELPLNEQQILLLDLATLGTVFTSQVRPSLVSRSSCSPEPLFAQFLLASVHPDRGLLSRHHVRNVVG